jgi:hypothetical protein
MAILLRLLATSVARRSGCDGERRVGGFTDAVADGAARFDRLSASEYGNGVFRHDPFAAAALPR